MKKLMIAAAIVCAAAFSQAATCSWSTGYVWGNLGGVNNYDTGSVGSYWLVALGSTDVANYAVDTHGALVYKNDGKYQKTGVAGTAITDPYGVAGQILDLTAANNGDKYALIIYDSSVGAWGVSDVAMLAGISADPPLNANDITFSNYIDMEWDNTPEVVANQALVNVPEPTSGLLLLLGVAGLALKRRRA